MKIPQFVRRVAFVTALVVTSVAVPARIASAQPNDVCQNLVNQAALELEYSFWWVGVAQMYLNLGNYSLASEASSMAEIHVDFANAYVTEYSLYCR